MSPLSLAYEATPTMHSIHSILEDTTTPVPTSPQPPALGLGITTTTPSIAAPLATTSTAPTSTPNSNKTALYQSYQSQIENLKRLPVPYSDIYHALSSYDTIPFPTLVERFQRAAADLRTWLETAEMAVFALAMDVGQEGASDKREIGEIDVIMNRFHPNIEMLVELKERIESRIKEEVATGNSAAASSEQDLQQTTQTIKSSWGSLKQTLEKVKGDLAGSRLRSELLTHMDNVLNDIEDICASIDAYNLERSAITSDEEGFLPSRISTSQEDAKAKARSLETLAQVDSRIELLISRVDFLDNRVGSLPTDDSGVGSESKDALQSRYQQVQLRWDDLKFRRERVSDELKEDKWLEVFEQVAEQVESMMESMERAIIHCQGLLDQIRGMVREKVVPDAPIDRDHLYSIFKSFEAKHKYYAPAVNKMLDMLENGIESRMTRNHDVIQRHQAMNIKWDRLQDGLEHVDRGLDGVERWLDILDASRLPYLPALPLKQVEKKPATANGRRPVSGVQSPLQQRQQQQKLQQQQQQQQQQRGRRPLPNSATSSPSPSPAPGRAGTRSPLSSGYGNYRAWSPASSNDGIAYQSMLTASSLNNYRSLSPSPTRSPTRNGRSRPWCPSVSVSSPGIPGFPQEISPAATYFPRPNTSADVYRNDSPAPGPVGRAGSAMSGSRSATGTPSMLKTPVQYKPVFSPAGSRSKLSTGIQAPLNGTTPATRKTQLPQPASRTTPGAGAASPNRPQSRGYGREATSPIPSYGSSSASSRLPTSASRQRQVTSPSNQFGYSSHGPEGRSSPASSVQRGYYEERGQYSSRPGSATGSVSSVGRSAYSYRSYDEPPSPSATSASSISSASRYHSQQHHQKSLPEMMEKMDIRIEDVEPYAPIRGDELDEEFARVVNASPIQMKVQRLSEGKYYFGGRLQEQGSGMTLVGGKLVLCRLMVYGRIAGEDDSGVSSGGSHSGTDDGLHVPSSGRPKSSMGRRSGTSTPSGDDQKKPSKVMVRVGGGWQDLDIFLLDHSSLASEGVVIRGY
ncbi:hypothetical protein BGZ93_011290 [Podila epicladia]|nr:hypothetical protein BGZ92_000991 [Podila epicladia]KAG0086853.1 hypothetical protein BGZ93_011290 [Podila epicladia]